MAKDWVSTTAFFKITDISKNPKPWWCVCGGGGGGVIEHSMVPKIFKHSCTLL